MGEKISLVAEDRTVVGKKVKQLRKQGLVPGVVYGHDVAAKPVTIQAVAATKAWRAAGKHHVIEVTIGGKKQLTMIKSADVDPVKHSLRHLSLFAVKQNEKVEAEIPLKVAGEGETPAEKAGLVVLKALEAIQVQSLPAALPDFLEVPGDKLVEPGDHLTVADIMPIKGVEILTDPEVVVVSAYEPSALAAQNENAAGEATEGEEPEAEDSVEENDEHADNSEGREK
ncbi:MAG TPA: 50S ribosomal protein L25 [Candidatus Saccharimonas sp.]|nr:50S ribosomal protein L25 [Candidatus Saccharimonas sp.]